MMKLADYAAADITAALTRCQNIIDEKPPKTPATAVFWKAVENRLKLQRELVIRGEADKPLIALPADRLPIVTIEHSGESY